MGNYDFRSRTVLTAAKQLLVVKRIKRPAWFTAVSENPPPEILTRTTPIQHAGYVRQKPNRKLRKQFLPQQITYPEDRMRKTFFTDHPWELARPRILVEGNKLDGGEVWDGVRPVGLGLQPENVIRRQLWLIEHDKLTPQEAYDTARREFYHQRFREDVERKVAKEEALHMGAYFGKSTITWGMELEDRKFYGFKQWAKNRLARIESQKQSMALGGVDTGAPPGMEEDVLGESTDDTATAAAADVNALSSQTRASAKAGSAAGSIPPIQIPEHRKVDFGLRL